MSTKIYIFFVDRRYYWGRARCTCNILVSTHTIVLVRTLYGPSIGLFWDDPRRSTRSERTHFHNDATHIKERIPIPIPAWISNQGYAIQGENPGERLHQSKKAACWAKVGQSFCAEAVRGERTIIKVSAASTLASVCVSCTAFCAIHRKFERVLADRCKRSFMQVLWKETGHRQAVNATHFARAFGCRSSIFACQRNKNSCSTDFIQEADEPFMNLTNLLPRLWCALNYPFLSAMEAAPR